MTIKKAVRQAMNPAVRSSIRVLSFALEPLLEPSSYIWETCRDHICLKSDFWMSVRPGGAILWLSENSVVVVLSPGTSSVVPVVSVFFARDTKKRGMKNGALGGVDRTN